MRDANSYRNAAFFPAFWFSAASPLILLHDWRKVYRSLWAAVTAALRRETVLAAPSNFPRTAALFFPPYAVVVAHRLSGAYGQELTASSEKPALPLAKTNKSGSGPGVSSSASVDICL